MTHAAARRIITDDLLAVAVRIKREAGIGHAEIQAVIDRFASEALWQERTGGIGFPLVEDIPQESRGEFLAVISDLAPSPERRLAPRVAARSLSPHEIWPSRSEQIGS